MIEVKNNSIQGNNSFRSINSIILRFPRFKEGLKEIQTVFELYGKFKKLDKIISLLFFFLLFLRVLKLFNTLQMKIQMELLITMS